MPTLITAKMPTITTAGISIPVITEQEVTTAIAAREEYLRLNKLATKADNAAKASLMVVFEKALGIKTMEEIKFLNVEELTKKFTNRIVDKEVVLKNKTKFGFLKTSSGTRPAWKEEFQKLAGDVAVNNIVNKTAETYSYSIVKA